MRSRKRTSITISEETLQLILTSAVDVHIRGGGNRIGEALLILALVDLGLDLHQNTIHAKLHNTQVQRLELLLNRRGIVASLLEVLRAHDGEQVVIGLAINVVLSSTEFRNTRLDVLLELLAIGHREEGTVQGRLRLTLVHGLGHLRSRQILLGDVATRPDALGLVGLLVALDLTNIRNTTRVLGRILDGRLCKKVRKGLHAYPKVQIKTRAFHQCW